MLEARPRSLPLQPAWGPLSFPGPCSCLRRPQDGSSTAPGLASAWVSVLVKHFVLGQQHQDILPAKTEVLPTLPSTPVKS